MGEKKVNEKRNTDREVCVAEAPRGKVTDLTPHSTPLTSNTTLWNVPGCPASGRVVEAMPPS